MKIWIDGSGYNGIESKYCVVIEGRDPIITVLKERKTNNEMEYAALYHALKECAIEGDVIYTDSQLLTGHITKNWKQKAEHLRNVIAQCKNLLNEKNIRLLWLPREENIAGKILEEKNERTRRRKN
jgi:ribonuclease HI